MNAYDLAQKHLAVYSDEYMNGIDPLIQSTCEFLTEQGFITLHSCSGHIKAQIYKDKNIRQIQRMVNNKWYILFVATKPISEMKKAVKYIEKEYGYKLELEKFPYKGLTRRWELQIYFSFNFNDDALIEFNENLEKGFKDAFKETSH